MTTTPQPARGPSGAGALTVRLHLDGRGEIERVGPYRVLGVLGRGGMGMVYEVVDDQGVVFALKIVELRFLQLPEIQAGRRFSQEISVLSNLSHPSVVKMYAYGYARHPSGSEQAFFVMERLYGETLDKLIAREHRFRTEEAARTIGLLAHALDYLEAQGVIHRDLKPSNIMIDSADRVVLMDFGLARSEELTRLTRAGQIIGTLAYMSPERLCGVQSTVSSDVYALGVVLYELLTGNLPFTSQDPSDLVQKIMRGVEFPSEFGRRTQAQRLRELVLGMLAKDGAARMSAREVVRRCLEIHPLEHGPTVEPTIADLSHWMGTGTLTPQPRSAPARGALEAPVAARGVDTTAPIPAAIPAFAPPPPTSIPGAPPRPGPSWAVAISLAALTFGAGALVGSLASRTASREAPLSSAPIVVPVTPPPVAPVVVVEPAEPSFDSAEAAFAYGDQAAREGRRQSAVRAFERAIELNPVHAEAYRRLGDVLLSLGDERGALKRYSAFLKLRPDAPDAEELRKLLRP